MFAPYIAISFFTLCYVLPTWGHISDSRSCNFNFLRSRVAQEKLAAGWFAQMPGAAQNIIRNQKLAPGGDLVSLFAEYGRPGFKDTMLTLDICLIALVD